MSSKLKNLAILVALFAAASTASAQAEDPLAAKTDSNDSPLLQKAQKLHYAGKAKEATELYREVIRTEPDNAKAHQLLGAALAATGTETDDEKTRIELDDTAILEEKLAIKLDPKFNLPHVVLGKIYANRHQYDEAIKEFKLAIALKPTAYRPHLDIGVAFMSAGRGEEAIAEFKRASEIKPEYPAPHINMGVTLQSMGDFKGAVEAVNKGLSLKINPEEAIVANYNLANIYADMNDPDNAIKCYQIVLKSIPNHPLAQSGVGWMQGAKGEYDADISCQRKVLKGSKDPVIQAIARGRLATALAAKGDIKAAEQEFEKCMAMKPLHPLTLMDYGRYLEKNGRKDEAKTLFQKALTIQPSFKPAKEALAKLENGKTQTK